MVSTQCLKFFILFKSFTISLQAKECQKVEQISNEICLKPTSDNQATAKYGYVELESLFINGQPDPSLVDVPKLFFLEVRIFTK